MLSPLARMPIAISAEVALLGEVGKELQVRYLVKALKDLLWVVNLFFNFFG